MSACTASWRTPWRGDVTNSAYVWRSGRFPSQLVASVLREGIALAGIGLTIGAAAALGIAQLLRSQLFGVTPSDPATYAIVLASLGLVLILACWLPARRTSAANPLDALRTE